MAAAGGMVLGEYSPFQLVSRKMTKTNEWSKWGKWSNMKMGEIKRAGMEVLITKRSTRRRRKEKERCKSATCARGSSPADPHKNCTQHREWRSQGAALLLPSNLGREVTASDRDWLGIFARAAFGPGSAPCSLLIGPRSGIDVGELSCQSHERVLFGGYKVKCGEKRGGKSRTLGHKQMIKDNIRL